MATSVAIGVENGGTWIRLKALNASGRVVWSAQHPSPKVENLPQFLQTNLKRFRGQIASLTVGSRGVWAAAKQKRLSQRLRRLAKQVHVMSDVEAAWHNVFTTNGIVLIAGTGSIAYGRRKNGAFARAGGLGPQKGDEGSAFWIGKEWLDGRTNGMSVRHVASLAKGVIQRANAGDQLAESIVAEGQWALVEMVQQVARQLRWKGTLRLSLHGSVWQNAWFAKGFVAALKTSHTRVRLVPAEHEVAYTLARLSRNSGL